MRKLALLIVLVSALFAGTYYFSKSKAFEEYRIKPLDKLASVKKFYKININLANVREFDNLPGVGPALAERIVENRERYGSFRGVEDITRVKGIGDKKMAKIREFLAA
jgi:comEA protein